MEIWVISFIARLGIFMHLKTLAEKCSIFAQDNLKDVAAVLVSNLKP